MRARDRLIIALAVLFIGACALVTAARIIAWSHSPPPCCRPTMPPPPLVVTVSTASPTATTPASSVSTTARPRRTVTAWVTVTAPPG